MTDLQTGYKVPGVYVQDTTEPMLTSAGFPESIVTLVGPATGYQVGAEVVTLNAVPTVNGDTTTYTATPVVLGVKGIWLDPTSPGAPSGIKAVKVTTTSGKVLTAGADYTLHETLSITEGAAAKITDLSIGSISQRVVDGVSAAQTAGGLKPGDQVIVTYSYTDANYYTPLLFEDFDRVEAVYGDALLRDSTALPSTPQIISPLSFAALLAFANGATRVICVATDPGDGNFDQRLVKAYGKTAGDYRANLIVPILATDDSGDSGAFNSYAAGLKTYVEDSTINGFQRIGIIGPSVKYGLGNTEALLTLGPSISAKRVIAAFPNRLNFYNSGTGRTIEVDGYYLAVAYAARLAGQPVQVGLTRQQVYGFAGFPASVNKIMTKEFKDRMSASGVAVSEIDRQNRLIVRHGLSTDTRSVITREVSITRARDALFESLQLGLDASGLIGSPIDAETTTRVKGAVQGILETNTASGVIVDYADLKVRQQTLSSGGDPTVIEVKFAYQPAVPLNYILVSFALNLTSGAVSVTDIAA